MTPAVGSAFIIDGVSAQIRLSATLHFCCNGGDRSIRPAGIPSQSSFLMTSVCVHKKRERQKHNDRVALFQNPVSCLPSKQNRKLFQMLGFLIRYIILKIFQIIPCVRPFPNVPFKAWSCMFLKEDYYVHQGLFY